MSDDKKGLYPKYNVYKADNHQMVDGCFVLRPDKDPAAQTALLTYAALTKNQQLKADIKSWSNYWPAACDECGELSESIMKYQADDILVLCNNCRK